MLWNIVLHLSAVIHPFYWTFWFLWIVDIMVEGLILFLTYIVSQTDEKMIQAPRINARVGVCALANLTLVVCLCFTCPDCPHKNYGAKIALEWFHIVNDFIQSSSL